MHRLRLDEVLVARGFYPSRSRARDAVLRGTVKVDGAVARKPAQHIDRDAEIAVTDEARFYVSRGALKLKAALDRFGLNPRERDCLDIGASTGGFTQVLLERCAFHVTAIDVGHDQLAESLRRDPRVISIEGLNARDLTYDDVGYAPQFITADVSFISLKQALPPALRIAREGASLVALIKPQFEAGRAAVPDTGIVTDPAVHAEVCRDIHEFLGKQGWTVLGLMPSPIEGGDGNLEFLIAARKD
jgi:23S rRNA (cytidine1920-2'-O)/16S rRNA (cytidine1409-2'-O)-methyltransferase